MIKCAMNAASALEVSIDKILEVAKQFSEHIYEATQIFMGNPSDLIEMDMSKIPSNCYFISNSYVDIGTMYKVEDGEFKRSLYNFIEEHPDRVFRGEK